MANYLLDTNVLIHIMRGQAKAKRVVAGILAEGHSLASCGIVVSEFYSGMREKDARLSGMFIRSLKYFDLSAEAATKAGLIKRDFSAKGITLSMADCLIAAVCIENDAILVTENVKDFPAKGLQVVDLRQ